MDVEVLLKQYRQGLTKDFDILTSKLKDPHTDNKQLLNILKALRDCVAQLGSDVEVLVGVLLQMDWTSKDGTVIDAYRTLILNIISAQPAYLGTLLRSLIKQLIPNKAVVSAELRIFSDELRSKHDGVFKQVHTVIYAVANIVPMTVTLLPTLLSDLFPYIGNEPYILECYVRNMLQIVHYMPRLRLALLELVVDRMVKIDVRVSREAIQEAENEGVDQEIFDMDTDLPGTAQLQHDMAHPDAQRLDVLMELLLHFIKKSCFHKESDLDWEATKGLYKDLLHIFERTILPTHQSCHVQFVLFYICSFKAALAEGFTDYLLKKVQDPNLQPPYRQAAASYLASFLARAKYINTEFLRSTLDVLTQWLRRYIKHAAHSEAPLDIVHHAPFYVVCQGLFYVFIFRHKELIQTPEGLKECENLQLQRIVSCRLNPLKFCMPVIVNTFASITRQHQLAQCDTIIEKNKRAWLPVSTPGKERVAAHGTMVAYFPFDPYLLHKSGCFIIDIYREYEGSIVQDTTEDEQDDEEPELVEEYGDVEGSPVTKDMSLGKSPMDMLAFALSPGFHVHS